MTASIGITCVGSGIGQSVVDTLRLSRDSFRTIGFDINPLAYGGLYCDAFYTSMPNQESGYVDSLLDICRREKIEFLIPCLDSELLVLSKARKLFEDQKVDVLVPPESIIQLCLDKKRLSQELNILFPEVVASYSLEEAEEAIEKGRIRFPLIAKPITGSGSAGIRIVRNPDELKGISENLILQPIVFVDEDDPDSSLHSQGIKGGEVIQVAEVSVQYLVSKKGNVLGRIATRNRLKAGVPVEIIPVDSDLIWDSTQKVVEHLVSLGAWGPVNLQGRLYSKRFHIFEINPRFTGLTGLRAKMGFNEVEALLLDHRGDSRARIQSALEYNPCQFGVRQINDTKFFSWTRPTVIEHLKSRKADFIEYRGKVILLTGATGYVGQNLLRKLLKIPETKRVIAVARNREIADSVFGSIEDENLSFFYLEEAPVDSWNLGQVDTIVHLGDARPPEGGSAIAKSLGFTKKVVMQASAYQIAEFVYISSQAVYGEKTSPDLWDESSLPSPDSPYAMAKLAGEMLVMELRQLLPRPRVWILRLSRVYGKGYGMRWHEMPHKFVSDFRQKREISILGGSQAFDLIHIEDVLSSIHHVLKAEQNKNKSIYNLGGGRSVTIRELADCVNRAAGQIGLERVPIRILPGEDERKFGMDSTLFCRDFAWKHQVSLEKGILELVRMREKEKLS